MKFSTKVLYIAGSIVSALILICILWFFPRWQSAAYMERFPPEVLQELKPAERVQLEKNAAEIENSNRVTIAQIIGGLALLSGLYFTYKNIKVNEEGKITERFSKAVEMLANEQLDVRLGGIYALERIARDSQKDHWTVMEVLTAFVRENSQIKFAAKTEKSASLSTERDSWAKFNEKENIENETEKPREDIQAIMTVIGRRKWKESETKPLNLQGVNLSKLDLSELDLSRANLSEANLSGTNLEKVDLEKANLVRANLVRANLRGANLRGVNLIVAELSEANLVRANLRGANLRGVNLRGANLVVADLSRAKLREANLVDAVLSGADLSGADLSGADLSGAYLQKANLRGVFFELANLKGAFFIEANLKRAYLGGAKLSGAYLSGSDLNEVRSLTIEQLIQVKNYDDAILSSDLKEELEKWKEEQSKENEQ